MSIRIQCVTVDCSSPQRLADFWSKALDWRITYEDEDEYVIEPAEDDPGSGVIPDVLFNRVQDDKTVKNRWHFDLRPSDDQNAEVTRLMKLGARQIDIGQSGDESWVVMADPEGNEFCVLGPLEADEEEAA
jgi:predicted enzyme related to lactoylglutathione lyase